MLIDDVREQLKKIEPDLQTVEHCWRELRGQEELEKLSQTVRAEDAWQSPEQIALFKQVQKLRQQNDRYNEIRASYAELKELIELFQNDETHLHELKGDVDNLVRSVAQFKHELLLSGPQDEARCFLSVNAGAGGTESQDWAEMLLRMYIRFCEREKFGVSVIDYQAGEGAGIKSATLFIKGKNAFGLLKSEHGIHRLVRISPYDANKRRHTSFASVFVLPEVEAAEITIDQKDLRIDTYRAGGAGGQHVNKTDSAVRITHIPTGIVVQCQSERSQTQNKETAMKMLMAKLKQKQVEEQQSKIAAVEKKSIEWGSQIRSYVLHPYKMVKDHRTDFESPQPELVLDGDLMPFIEKTLIYMRCQPKA